jgi:hypothetical protein
MQNLIDKSIITENRDAYMLHYTLEQPNMLSATAYRVLQGQKNVGLVPCYRVIYNNKEKLLYDIEQFESLSSLLSNLEPLYFLNYIKEFITIILGVKSSGFLHQDNLDITIDKIFINQLDNSVHMIYLPLQDNYMQEKSISFIQNFKDIILCAIQNHNNLHVEMVKPLKLILTDASSRIEQLYNILADLEPIITQTDANNTDTIAMNKTSTLSTSGTLTSGNLSRKLSHNNTSTSSSNLIFNEARKTESSLLKQNRKKGLFAGKKVNRQAIKTESDFGGTEVLTLFIPNIILKGENNVELLVEKQEYILGYDRVSVDGLIESKGVSRTHCKITYSDNSNFVTDLDSSNGTYLNGVKLESQKPRPINIGDKLKLANISFTIVSV